MRRRTIGQQINYYILLSIITAISYIPLGILYVLSDIIYYPFYFVVRYRRKIVRKNLTESFPNKSRQDIIRIERKFYHFLIDTVLESCKLISISPKQIKRRIKFHNIDAANEMLKSNKSISLFLGHYGNWEWVASINLWFYKESVSAQIYKKLSNPSVDTIMKRIRERWGATCIEMHNTARYTAGIATDNKPHVIGFIADQSPRKREAKHFITFLNHKVPVSTGSEKLTKHFNYEAFFLSIKRVKRGYYECELQPLHNNPASLQDFELTRLYYQRLEQEIINHPELYLWTHKRFRHAYTCQPSST